MSRSPYNTFNESSCTSETFKKGSSNGKRDELFAKFYDELPKISDQITSVERNNSTDSINDDIKKLKKMALYLNFNQVYYLNKLREKKDKISRGNFSSAQDLNNKLADVNKVFTDFFEEFTRKIIALQTKVSQLKLNDSNIQLELLEVKKNFKEFVTSINTYSDLKLDIDIDLKLDIDIDKEILELKNNLANKDNEPSKETSPASSEEKSITFKVPLDLYKKQCESDNDKNINEVLNKFFNKHENFLYLILYIIIFIALLFFGILVLKKVFLG